MRNFIDGKQSCGVSQVYKFLHPHIPRHLLEMALVPMACWRQGPKGRGSWVVTPVTDRGDMRGNFLCILCMLCIVYLNFEVFEECFSMFFWSVPFNPFRTRQISQMSMYICQRSVGRLGSLDTPDTTTPPRHHTWQGSFESAKRLKIVGHGGA